MRLGSVPLGVLSLAFATLLGCSADETSSPSSALAVTTATTGGQFDPDGYTLEILQR